jgi:hypothetical protein
VIDPFGFQPSKEAFSNGIIVAVALTAHAANHVMIFENFLVIQRSVLAAPVRMVQQARARVTTTQRHQQRLDGQLTIDRPTDYLPIEQIDQSGQIKPAFISPSHEVVDRRL